MADSYLSQPAIGTRQRRLFTFVTPLRLQLVPPDLLQTMPVLAPVQAAEGMEEEGDDSMAFLVLDTIWNADERHRLTVNGGPMIGVWVQRTNIASAQIQILPWERGPVVDLPGS